VLGSVADGVERWLDPRSIAVRRIAGAITTAILSGTTLIALVVRLLASRPTRTEVVVWLCAWAVLIVALGLTSWFWPQISYRYSSWRIESAGLWIRRGVLWRSIVSVPRSRIQHTDVRQGPVERAFGLATLVVHTAGTEHASIALSGVDRDTAIAVRDHLLDEHA
jgi:hypothetical protein